MSDDDWVVELLAAAEAGPMPDDVAERLELAVRAEVLAQLAEAAPADSTAAAAGAASPVAAASAASPVAADGAASPTADLEPPAPGLVPPPARGSGSGLVGVPADAPGRGPATAPGKEPGPEDDETPPDELARARAARSAGTSRRDRRAEQVGERRRRILTTWLPVAAGVVVLGGAGVAAVQIVGGDDPVAGTAETAAMQSSEAAPAPRGLLASGTNYTPADTAAFTGQVQGLVEAATGATASVPLEAPADAAGGSEGEDATGLQESAGALPDARSGASSSPLSDPAEYAACAEDVTDGATSTPVAIDLAMVDGVARTVVVVADATGAGYQVYVVGEGCDTSGSQFDFYTVP